MSVVLGNATVVKLSDLVLLCFQKLLQKLQLNSFTICLRFRILDMLQTQRPYSVLASAADIRDS